jgi:hypothetical protein
MMTVMDSNNVQATVGIALASAILGGPMLVTGAALAGSLIEIGKIALQYARAKHSFQKLERDHDLAFIIEAKERLEQR